ncbi:MAG: nucleosidase [Acidimicrobiales bacterium]
MPGRFLIVAATRVEVAALPPSIPVVLTGVGKTAAATATTRAVIESRSRDVVVLNVGTAGALRPGLTGLFRPSTVVNHDISAELIRSLGLPVADELPVAAGDGTVLATGDVFVTDPAVRDRLAERAHLVDMEGFAVAYAATQLGVEVRMAKHVSDSADDSALEWSSAVEHSAHDLAEWVTAQLDGA